MAELAALAETAGSEVLDGVYPAPRQARPRDLHRLAARSTGCARSCVATGADTVICDGELAPSQLRNLEDRRQGQGRRPDRADPRHLRPARQVAGGQGAGRAGPAEYMMQRLRGWGGDLSRQAGGRVGAAARGIGGRGPGETKIEIDRRRIHTKIAKLRRELARHEEHPRHQAPGAPSPPRPERRDRRLHQRRQVLAAQPAHRRRRARRERAVRDPRPDHAAHATTPTAASTR